MKSPTIFTLTGNTSAKKADSSTQEAPLTKGLFTPIQLEPVTTTVFLEDYFPNGEMPDKVSVYALTVEIKEKEKQLLLTLEDGQEIPALSFLGLQFGDFHYQIPLKRSRVEKYTFVFDPQETFYKKVQLGSIINDYVPEQGEMQFRNGKWYFETELPPGLYPYQFVVDGEWILDPLNLDKVPNGLGSFNSQVQIGNLTERISWKMKATKTKLEVKVKTEDVVVLAMHENEAVKVKQGKNGAFSIPFPKEAQPGRTHIRIFLGNNATGEVVDVLVPLTDGKPVSKADQLETGDQHNNIIYFMLVDRFFNGDPTNDPRIYDERVAEKVDYHGGDLAGIKQKIEEGFFNDLGSNVIWISPLYKNPDIAYQEYPEPRRWFSGYHGYWPISSTEIDHRFGTKEILKSLVDTAHDNDQKVILDFVANHVHEDHPLIQENPEWKTDLYLEDGTINIRLFDAQRLTTWFDTFLPSLDFSCQEVIEVQSDYALYWLEEFNLDGFRHDATKHVPETFWRRLNQKIKQKVERPLFQIGETVGNRALVGHYVNSGMLDGQFDFSLFYDLRDALGTDATDARQVGRSLMASIEDYGYHNLMGNFTGTHDMPRLIAYASGALEFFEDPKEAGWNREVGVPDPVGYDKITLLHAFLMMVPGVPVIYYGDEIGMSGGDDPDNRDDMRFDGLNEHESRMRDTVKQLAHFRTSHLATIYGHTETYAGDRSVLYIVRRYLGEVVVAVINFREGAQPISFPQQFDLPTLKFAFGTEGASKKELPSYSFAVFTGKE